MTVDLSYHKPHLERSSFMSNRYFSTAVSTSANRKTFVANILKVYKQYNIDGIDMYAALSHPILTVRCTTDRLYVVCLLQRLGVSRKHGTGREHRLLF